MSKYNLSDILNEYIGGGRIGTLKISFKDLQDKMDDLEQSGKVIVREKGSSADGKVYREFEVVDRDSAVPGGNKQERGFTVYDYKFGFDPAGEDYFMNEYPFSVGGNDLKLAMELIDGVEEYKFEESINENRREKNPEGMGQLYVQPAVQREVKFHLDAYDKGDIDIDDMIQAIEDIIFGYVKAPGQRMEESTGPSDKAETEDDVVNIDKVAGPSAKGVGYGAETSANTAEDDMEDKEIANPRPMYENGDTSDFTSELKEADNMEVVALLNNIRKHLNDKFDRKYSKSEIDLYMDSLKRDIKRGEFDGVESISMEDHEEDFENYIADKSLQEHFQRFM